ncbi:MAG: MogA/MoaB family molybdenum cofactor biosynthesis protein, partial [Peptococcaceae bacterium]|nr:MogA/MoaB family molybdenum cofactor biosynthesis protein [Peptococcaceae bacterium]
MTYKAAVITVSDKGFRGEREDTSGPNLVHLLTDKGFDMTYTSMVPDEAEAIQRELCKCADELGIALVLTTGGTGFSPRDITPEATLAVVERLTPGIPEAMRRVNRKACGCLDARAVLPSLLKVQTNINGPFRSLRFGG